MNDEKKVRTNISLSTDLWEKLKIRAFYERRSLSALIEDMVVRGIESEIRKEKEVADAGDSQ